MVVGAEVEWLLDSLVEVDVGIDVFVGASLVFDVVRDEDQDEEVVVGSAEVVVGSWLVLVLVEDVEDVEDEDVEVSVVDVEDEDDEVDSDVEEDVVEVEGGSEVGSWLVVVAAAVVGGEDAFAEAS